MGPSLGRVPGTLRGPPWPGSEKGQRWGYGGWCEDIKVVFGYNSKFFVGYMPKKAPKLPDIVLNPPSYRVNNSERINQTHTGMSLVNPFAIIYPMGGRI